jgi:hypothetical protein
VGVRAVVFCNLTDDGFFPGRFGKG